VAAVAAVVLALVSEPGDVTYGELGTRSATAFVEQHRDDDTPVFYFEASVHMIGSEPPVDVEVSPNPDSLQGFDVHLGSGRVGVSDPVQVTTDQVDGLVGDADVVLVHDAFVGFGDSARGALGEALGELGYRLDRVARFPVSNEVEVWVRGS
jgi:hypothetical protein